MANAAVNGFVPSRIRRVSQWILRLTHRFLWQWVPRPVRLAATLLVQSQAYPGIIDAKKKWASRDSAKHAESACGHMTLEFPPIGITHPYRRAILPFIFLGLGGENQREKQKIA
jgi:hypothetical protein